MGDVKAKALAAPLAFTLAEGGDETHDETNSQTVEDAVVNRLGDTSAMCRPRHWLIYQLTLYQWRTLREVATH